MLQYIGTKFLEKHQDKIKDLLYDWNTGVKGFTSQVIFSSPLDANGDPIAQANALELFAVSSNFNQSSY